MIHPVILMRDAEARGRSGWFKAETAAVFLTRGQVWFDVFSKRQVYPGPIHIEMGPRTAWNVGRLLMEAAKHLGQGEHTVVDPFGPGMREIP